MNNDIDFMIISLMMQVFFSLLLSLHTYTRARVVINRNASLACDFETVDLCGWHQDIMSDEFDWKRNQFSTPSGHAGTGPSFDHTLGSGKPG